MPDCPLLLFDLLRAEFREMTYEKSLLFAHPSRSARTAAEIAYRFQVAKRALPIDGYICKRGTTAMRRGRFIEKYQSTTE